jgi:hypothetical protein
MRRRMVVVVMVAAAAVAAVQMAHGRERPTLRGAWCRWKWVGTLMESTPIVTSALARMRC